MKTQTVHFEPVGRVHNEISTTEKIRSTQNLISTIEVFEDFAEGLYQIETCEYLDVLFYFHQSLPPESLRGRVLSGEEKGVFASRSPRRPNAIGATTVRLISRDANRLTVSGLDAIDGSPVLDLKPCNTSHLEKETLDAAHRALQRSQPRMGIWKHILAGDTAQLLLMAGRMHGHFCPGLAMGVMAATRAMQHLKSDSDGMEDLLAIVETNNCFADGIQMVTGCSLGNNGLIFKDLGKTAFTLTLRDGKGYRIISRHDSQQLIRSAFPDFDYYYEKVVQQKQRDESLLAAYRKSGIERAFGTLKLDFDLLFNTSKTRVNLPDYAPSHESYECCECGESVMATRTVATDNGRKCLFCAASPIGILDGYGIRVEQP